MLADVDRSRSSTEDVPDLGVKGLLIVSTNVDESDGNYSPGDLSLREALLLAAGAPGNDVIQFDNSLRDSTITLVPALRQLVIDSNVDIQGLGADQLTVDAGGSSVTRRVFHVATNVEATISGLTISGGNAQYSEQDDGSGGGILNEGTLTLIDSDVSNNHVGNRGAGILNAGTARLTLIRTAVSDNQAENEYGGAIYNEDLARVVATDVTIARNFESGGIVNHGELELERTSIDHNTSGGVRNYGTATLINVTISDNSSEGSGSGVYNRGVLTLIDSTISGNGGGRFGGGIGNFGDGSVTLENVTISANRAEDGAGIANFATLTASNTTISSNEAETQPGNEAEDWGGGIYNESGTATVRLVNTTISDNSAGMDGGGIYTVSGNPTLYNTLVAGNVRLPGGGHATGRRLWCVRRGQFLQPHRCGRRQHRVYQRHQRQPGRQCCLAAESDAGYVVRQRRSYQNPCAAN